MENQDADILIINRVLAGEQQAYAVLVKKHQRYVFTLALRFAKSREDAEEIAQDVFIKAYRSLANFQQGAKFSTWLYSIVYTTSMTFLRKKKLDVQSIDDEHSGIQLETSISAFTADRVEQKSKYAYLNQAISQLLPDDAAIITLFYQGEQSLEEISQAMNLETNTVKVKLHRARQRLRDKLEKLLGHEVKELI